jgi:hypothetical protein
MNLTLSDFMQLIHEFRSWYSSIQETFLPLDRDVLVVEM